MRDKIETLYQSNNFFRYLIKPFKSIYDYYCFHILNEETFIKNKFKRIFKKNLDLKNPKTLNEKIQWLKLNDRTKLHTICSDKYEVRNYVKDKIGEKYLVPLLFHTTNYKDLIPENLPSEPFIIKTTHDSGGTLIVNKKNKISWKKVRVYFKKRLNKNYYWATKEWQYKNIKPKIIIEKLLLNDKGEIPNDIKFHCFNGKVQMICVDINRGKKSHNRNWYNRNWEREPYSWSSIKKGRKTDPANYDIEKPYALDKMINLSESLAANFYYVRIDWYEVKEKLFFGEMTFHHDSGFRPIEPVEWDLKLGDLLKLN